MPLSDQTLGGYGARSLRCGSRVSGSLHSAYNDADDGAVTMAALRMLVLVLQTGHVLMRRCTLAV